MNELDQFWANEEREPWDAFWDKLGARPLLYLHGLLEQLDRRLALMVDSEFGAGTWDEYYHDTRQLRAMAVTTGMRVQFRNYEKLRAIVRENEQQEIAQLTGRAA